MNGKNSYFQDNPLFGLTNSIVSKTIKHHLPPKIPPSVITQLHENEDDFMRQNPLAHIYEFIYYKQYNYRTLPSHGWIKPCIKCFMNTSSTLIYSHVHRAHYRHFRIYLCPECCNKNKNNLKYNCTKIVTKYLRDYLYFLPPTFFWDSSKI